MASDKKFKVICPQSPYRVERTMWIRFVPIEDGPFPLPCNGCDNMSGAKLCERCCAAITLMFFNDPDLDTSEPLVPKLSDS